MKNSLLNSLSPSPLGALNNPMQQEKKTAVIYARFSSSNQREESIEDQIRVCKDYATANGIDVIYVYEDRAKTGTNDQRPGFQTMIFDSRKRTFNMVIVYKIDRFSRNQYDHTIYQEQLKRNGVTVVSATEPLTNDVNGKLMRAIFQAMSENYSIQLSENIRRGHHGNAIKCKANGGKCPFGYKVNPDTRLYEIDPDTAPIVQEIFARAVNGQHIRKIREWLDSLGYKFSYNGIYKMFRNERYIGYYIYSDVRVENGMPQLIDNATFERARELADQRQLNHCCNPDNYLLSGKLTCGVCGSRMNGEYGKSKTGQKHLYYFCHGLKTHKCKCTQSRIRAVQLETQVLEAITALVSSPEMVKQLTNAIMEAQEMDGDEVILRNYEKQLKEIRKSKANILKAIEQGAFNSMINKRLEELDANEDTILNQIQRARLMTTCFNREEVEEYLNNISDLIKEDPILQKDLIDILVTEIIVDGDKITCIYDLRNEKSTDLDKKKLDPSMIEGVRVNELWWR